MDEYDGQYYDENINNITALISVLMQNAMQDASYYTIHSGRKIVSSTDISMALKREMFIFMERNDTEDKTNEMLDEIELEKNIKTNLTDEELEKFEEIEEQEIQEIQDSTIIDDDTEEIWTKSNCSCNICTEINLYYEKFSNFKPSTQFETMVYNSIINIDNKFNL